MILLLLFLGCGKDETALRRAMKWNDSIAAVYAPDKRVAVYDISVTEDKGNIEIRGKTDQVEALQALRGLLRKKNYTTVDHAIILPDASVDDFRYAVVNNSVANIRSQGKHSAELATQALLGTALRLLQVDGDFYLVQTPDGYIAWVDHGGVVLMNQDAYRDWSQLPKLIVTQTYGAILGQAGYDLDKVGDVVMGDILAITGEQDGYYEVSYPDGRRGFLETTACAPYDEWLFELQPSGDLVELYARQLLGAPYLWGGTSVKGMDCSGFTKTVYLMNGFVIPRDASQQIHAGLKVDPDNSFSGLEKGDLLFFGSRATDSTKQRVTHVGIWLGEGQFIHASGRVRLSSVDPNSSDYDQVNKERYLGSRRYLGQEDPLIQKLSALKTPGTLPQ